METAPPPPPSPSVLRPWDWYKQLSAGLGFVLPIVLAGVPVLVAELLFPGSAGKVVSLASTTIIAIDVAIVFGLCVQLKWWFVLAVVYWIEFLLLAWLIKNLDLLRRWRFMSAFLQRREDRALAAYQRHRWIRRFHFVGVMLFTFLPLGSGVFVGTFIGKVTGMPDRIVFLAVYLGTVLWASTVAIVIDLSLDSILEWIRKIAPNLNPCDG